MSPYEFTGIVAEKCGVLVNFTLGMLFSMMAVLYSFFFIKDSRQIRAQRLQAELAEQLHELRLSKRFEGDVTVHVFFIEHHRSFVNAYLDCSDGATVSGW